MIAHNLVRVQARAARALLDKSLQREGAGCLAWLLSSCSFAPRPQLPLCSGWPARRYPLFPHTGAYMATATPLQRCLLAAPPLDEGACVNRQGGRAAESGEGGGSENFRLTGAALALPPAASCRLAISSSASQLPAGAVGRPPNNNGEVWMERGKSPPVINLIKKKK
jgi:hypothetical protein